MSGRKLTVQQVAEAVWPTLLDPSPWSSLEDFRDTAVALDDDDGDGSICIKQQWGDSLNPNSHWYLVGLDVLGSPTVLTITGTTTPTAEPKKSSGLTEGVKPADPLRMAGRRSRHETSPMSTGFTEVSSIGNAPGRPGPFRPLVGHAVHGVPPGVDEFVRGRRVVFFRRSSHVDISPLYAIVVALLSASTASLEAVEVF